MIIRFLVNEVLVGKNTWMPSDTRIGGTEESVVEWATLLSKDHQVQVFSNFREQTPFYYRGAEYMRRGEYLEEARKAPGRTINVMSRDIPPVEPTIYLTNETNAAFNDLSAFGCVILPSHWAKDNIPVNNTVVIVPHGYNPNKIKPKRKIPKQCLYSSSPDRGLDDLALIWPSVVEKHPDARLYVTYGGKLGTPNTSCLGEVDEPTMNKLYATSEFWLHPCSGGELFGISGVKAQAAQAIPVYFPTMALAETVQIGEKCDNIIEMHDKLVALMDDLDRRIAYRATLARIKLPTWEDSTGLLFKALMKYS